MQMIHCDSEDCKSAEPFSVENDDDPTSGMPKGWAFLQWQTDGKGESNFQSKVMARYFKAISQSLPKRSYGDDGVESLRRVSEDIEAPPDILLTFRAYICPKCLGKFPLAGFNLVGRGYPTDRSIF